MELPLRTRKNWIEINNSDISLNRQLWLVNLSKSSYYYEPKPESQENLDMMEMIDKIYTESPSFGSRRMVIFLNDAGYNTNRKRVIRLMQNMGIRAIFPKRKTSISNKQHFKYPYLLKDVVISHPNHAWSTDITYIRVSSGYLYLTAILDLYSRYIISWRLSNTLDVVFCVEALQEALDVGRPIIFNSDQGCQYTSDAFTNLLKLYEIEISMAGKGRCFDNIFVERLWRTIKYEEVYLKRYENGEEANNSLKKYLDFYNKRRPHQALNYKTPESFYFGVGKSIGL